MCCDDGQQDSIDSKKISLENKDNQYENDNNQLLNCWKCFLEAIYKQKQ